MSVPVQPGAGQTLQPAFRLDEAPGPEIYVALLTDEPIDSADVADTVDGWVTTHGVTGLVDGAPSAALGGAVEVLAFDKRVEP
jgi:hypothetical protein